MSKLHSSHYGNVSTDPVGNGRGPQGIRGAQFGNHWSKENKVHQYVKVKFI
jgi:hypothetical protein